jgi:hypothetical protein
MKGFLVLRLMVLAASLQQIETALVQQGKTAAEIKKALDQAGKSKSLHS